jgi:transposase-like protein
MAEKVVAGMMSGPPATLLALKIPTEDLAVELLERAKSQGADLVGPGGLLAELTKRVLEAGLDAEMTEHVGYAPYERAGHGSGNSRNGTRAKTVLTDIGPVQVEVPRDRAGTFEPVIVPKRQRRLGGVDQMVLSLSAKGLTHGEISAYLEEVYGAKVSKETVTRITDRVIETMGEWQNRPLEPGRFLAVVANHVWLPAESSALRDCSGVWSARMRRGRWLSSRATRSRSGAP